MTKADTIFKENIRKIMEEGVWSEQARPKYCLLYTSDAADE